MPVLKIASKALEEAYFDFLCAKVGVSSGFNNFDGRPLRCLCKALFDTEFYYFVPHDENRAADGLELRTRFMSQCMGIRYVKTRDDYFSGPCTMLEMMVAMSYRIDELMYDPYNAPRVAHWFDIMLQNLGFEKFTDDIFDFSHESRVKMKCDLVLSRTYDPSGEGGLWPLQNPPNDQRLVELWYQMNHFMSEQLAE